MSAPMLSLVPPPAPAPQPTGIDLETLGRERLRQMLGLRLRINAPTWNEILFASKRITAKFGRPSDRALARIDQTLDPPDPAAPPDAVDTEARLLLSGLANARPRPIPPRSIAGGPPLPPPRDLVAKWLRRVFLVVAGPEALRLLAGSGALTPTDVDVFDVVYPKGLEAEQLAATRAAQTLNVAASRNRVEDHGLPSWVNGQLLTLMDDRRPGDVYAEIYAQDKQDNAAKGPQPSQSNQPNLIAQQNAPHVGDDT